MNQRDRDGMCRLLAAADAIGNKIPSGAWGPTVGVRELSDFVAWLEPVTLYFRFAIMAVARPDAEDPELALQDLERAVRRGGSDETD